MGVEEQIATALLEGTTPAELVARGYAKSTVYKVLHSLRWPQVRLNYITWVETWQSNRDRYMPGETAQLTFSIRNPLAYDFYVGAVGIRPQWLSHGLWHGVEVRKLLHPGERLEFSFMLPIPVDLELGEKTVWPGIEGQVVGRGVSPPGSGVVWDPPHVLRVQHPRQGSVFLSHSVSDMHVVHELASYLDNYGLEPVVAEEHPMPGAVLEEKFAHLIRQSDLFVALLTSAAARSRWVRFEIGTAVDLHKPRIVLKEATVDIELPIEYIEFDARTGLQDLVQKLHMGLAHVWQQIHRPLPDAVKYALLAGFIGFVAGMMFSGRKGSGA